MVFALQERLSYCLSLHELIFRGPTQGTKQNGKSIKVLHLIQAGDPKHRTEGGGGSLWCICPGKD